MSQDGTGWTDPDRQADASLPQAGWYPDPEVAEGLRYWDGGAWTEHRHRPQPDPRPAPASEPAVEREPVGPGATEPASAPPTWASGGDPAAAAAGTSGTPDWASPTVVKRGVGTGAVIAIALVALLAGGVVGFGLRLLTEGDSVTIIGGGGDDSIDRVVTPGDRVDVELSSTALRIPLRIDSPGTYTIDAASDEFDTLLGLFQDGNELAFNDDGPFGFDSRIEVFLDPGDYTLELRAFSRDSGGSATITVR